MEVLHVYKQADLDIANNNGVISYDVYIHGSENVSFHNITRIEGYLGFSDVDIINLGAIEDIGGDLWVSTYNTIPDAIDLSILKRVGGNVNLNYTHIKSLFNLEYIGGDLDLLDSDIEDLGRVVYVGGDLKLPYRFKNNIELSSVNITGEIRYYRPSPKNVKLTKTQRGLTPSDKSIPIINAKNSFGLSPHYVEHLSEASKEQIEFFNYFKECFYNGIILDVKSFYEYPKFLVEDMLMDKAKPLSIWLEDYDRLIKAYPQVSDNAAYNLRWFDSRYDVGWELAKRKTNLDISYVGFFEEKLSKELFNVELLLKIDGAIELSPWGKQHLNEIIPFIHKEFDEFQKKWNRRFLQVFVDSTLNTNQSYDYYKQFYVTEEQFDFYNNIEYGKFLPTNYEKPLPNLVEHAIKEQCKKFSVDAEDSYRESIGMPKIGEYWRSETELYYSIKEAFKNTEVKQHASPRWLGLQHLDVYLPEFNIGIEYQGVQHYRPVDYFGGVEAFKKGQERDARKKRLCAENNCALLYVDEGYDLNEVINLIGQVIASKNNV